MGPRRRPLQDDRRRQDLEEADGGPADQRRSAASASTGTARTPRSSIAIIDCENIGKGPPPLPVYLGAVGADVGGKAKITQILPGQPGRQGRPDGRRRDHRRRRQGRSTASTRCSTSCATKKVRDKVTLTVARGGEKKSLEVTLTARPAAGGQARRRRPGGSRVWLGVTGEDRDGKVTLTQVIADGPAAKAGLKEGDVIVAVDGKAVGDYEKLLEAVRGKEAGDKVTLKIARGNETLEVAVTLEERPPAFGGRGGERPQLPAQRRLSGHSRRPTARGRRPPDADHRRRPGRKGRPGGRRHRSGHRRPEGRRLRRLHRGHPHAQGRRQGEAHDPPRRRAEGDRGHARESPRRPIAHAALHVLLLRPEAQHPGPARGQAATSTAASTIDRRRRNLDARQQPQPAADVLQPDPRRSAATTSTSTCWASRTISRTTAARRSPATSAAASTPTATPCGSTRSDGRHMIIGTDGGFYVTYDRGRNWDHLNTTALGQFYHVAVDPKRAVLGLRRPAGQRHLGRPGDQQERRRHQRGLDLGRRRRRLRLPRRSERPRPGLLREPGRQHEPAAPADRRAGRDPPGARPRGTPPLSLQLEHAVHPVEPQLARSSTRAGNYVFRSLDRGNDLQAISPEITLHQARHRHGPGRVAAQPERALGRHRRRRPVGDARRRPRVDERHQEPRPAAARAGWRRSRRRASPRAASTSPSTATAPTTTSRTSSSPRISARRGRSIRANLPWGSTRCLREDIAEREPAVLRHRVRPLGLARPRRALDEDQQQPADRRGPRDRHPSRPPARSSPRRTAAACGPATSRPCGSSRPSTSRTRSPSSSRPT